MGTVEQMATAHRGVASPRGRGRRLAVIELADRMRRCDCATAAILRVASEVDSPSDQGAGIFRHAAIHAGLVRPVNLTRFHVCPVCEARLDWPDG